MTPDRFFAIAENAIAAASVVLPEGNDKLAAAQRITLRAIKLVRKIVASRSAEKALALLEAIAGAEATKPITEAELDAQIAKVIAELTEAR